MGVTIYTDPPTDKPPAPPVPTNAAAMEFLDEHVEFATWRGNGS